MTHGLTGRAVMQKQAPHRNRRLLDVAHKMPCMAAFPHACNQNLGCHPAHANWQAWGKGVGLKVPDWAFAAVCGNAHTMIDGKIGLDTLPMHVREVHWLNAFISTHNWLWDEKRIRLS